MALHTFTICLLEVVNPDDPKDELVTEKRSPL